MRAPGTKLTLGAVTLVTMILVGACAGGADDAQTPAGAPAPPGAGGDADKRDADRMSVEGASDTGEPGAAYGAASGAGAEALGGAAPTTETDLPAIGPRVIKTADLRVEIERGSFRDALDRAMAAADAAGGYVLSTEVDRNRSRSGRITIRVPAERFESTLARIKDLGVPESERVFGEDVSEEFVDLEGRLRNLEAQEAVLLRLMDRAQTVKATILVQRELSGVQMQVERIKGRLRFLEDQTSFSTITARLVEEGAAPPRAAGTLARAWAQAKATALAVVSATIIGAGFVFPLLVLLALAWSVWKVLTPRLRKAHALR